MRGICGEIQDAAGGVQCHDVGTVGGVDWVEGGGCGCEVWWYAGALQGCRVGFSCGA